MGSCAAGCGCALDGIALRHRSNNARHVRFDSQLNELQLVVVSNNLSSGTAVGGHAWAGVSSCNVSGMVSSEPPLPPPFEPPPLDSGDEPIKPPLPRPAVPTLRLPSQVHPHGQLPVKRTSILSSMLCTRCGAWKPDQSRVFDPASSAVDDRRSVQKVR
mmetsp:Transcript_127504/g.254749  ORF Transcript_127504/g.254749 Transcript_127504/m.254749 type:complete len:159 (-) Transcript_127504:36-512(-)